VVVAIEDSKNLAEMRLEELQGSLEAHQQRMNERLGEKATEQALFAHNKKNFVTTRKTENSGGFLYGFAVILTASNVLSGSLRTATKSGDAIHFSVW
jgi:hypothetical protein